MGVHLLERDHELMTLNVLLDDCAAEKGHFVIISGEAGIGKTSLVEYFLSPASTHRHPQYRPLWAACEALFTPRPLGPIYDIAQQSGSSIRTVLERNGDRAALFATLLEELIQLPSIVVIEDIHWADEATLDLIKFLARRISRSPSLLIVTFRDDELTNERPIRMMLGELPTNNVTRLPLLPLSKAAVTVLEQEAHRPPGRLYAVTGGNPFFVNEALSYDAPGAPASVSDAVLARIARRSPAAQHLIEYVAVVPGQIERWVIAALKLDQQDVLDECLAAHLLHCDDETLAFRHEIARQAVEDALIPSRRKALHADILQVLVDHGFETTAIVRLVHHAVLAEDDALVALYAPLAAAQASSHGAHREAAALYQTALRSMRQAPAMQTAEIHDHLAREYYLTGQIQQAITLCEAALSIWRTLDQQEKVGRSLRHLSRLSWHLGRNAEAQTYGESAVANLDTLPPSRELAMAYANLAQLSSRTNHTSNTLSWGNRAISLAEPLNDHEILCYALNCMATAEIDNGQYDRGIGLLRQSLAMALEHNVEEHAARAYANLGIFYTVRHEYSLGDPFLRDGIAYCDQRDLDPWGHFMRWVRARSWFDQGNWNRAEDEANAILSISWMTITNRIPTLLILGRLHARRGDPRTQAILDEACELAHSIGESQRIEQVAAARAEWRWLVGDREGCITEASQGFHPKTEADRTWYRDEVVLWLWRMGALKDAPSGIRTPYSLEIAGDWRAAAAAWEQLGCPWEQAMSLLAGDEQAQRSALAIFEHLGAPPAIKIARRLLHARGVKGLPRGPHAKTRANPYGLTQRELDVLPLLAEGLSNAEIAHRLITSPRTIEHYVSALMLKLQARSRAEVVKRAYELTLLSKTPESSATLASETAKNREIIWQKLR